MGETPQSERKPVYSATVPSNRMRMIPLETPSTHTIEDPRLNFYARSGKRIAVQFPFGTIVNIGPEHVSKIEETHVRTWLKEDITHTEERTSRTYQIRHTGEACPTPVICRNIATQTTNSETATVIIQTTRAERTERQTQTKHSYLCKLGATGKRLRRLEKKLP